MAQAKYIIFDNGGLEIPVVFSPLLQHNQVASGLHLPVLSAGFCATLSSETRADKPKWICWGQSISLRIKSRESVDAEILNRYLEYDC